MVYDIITHPIGVRNITIHQLNPTNSLSPNPRRRLIMAYHATNGVQAMFYLEWQIEQVDSQIGLLQQ